LLFLVVLASCILIGAAVSPGKPRDAAHAQTTQAGIATVAELKMVINGEALVANVEGTKELTWTPGDPIGPCDTMDLEITNMVLKGHSPTHGPVVVRTDPLAPTYGMAVERDCSGPIGDFTYPADSFFDVFLEIEVGGHTYHNRSMIENPIHKEAVIHSLPPYHDPYLMQTDGVHNPPVPLYDGTGAEVGYVSEDKEIQFVEDPSFSIDKNGPNAFVTYHPADILWQPGGPPVVGVSCAGLGLNVFPAVGDKGCDYTGIDDDVDALSYGIDFLSPQGTPPEVGYVGFSVETGSQGQAGSAVNGEATCSHPEPEADEFVSLLNGSNTQMFDGDGAACDGNAGAKILRSAANDSEPASGANDDLDAVDGNPVLFVNPNWPAGDRDIFDVGIDRPVYFSLAQNSPTLAALPPGRLGPASAGEVLVSGPITGGAPVVYANENQLGIGPRYDGDELDGLCLYEYGVPDDYFQPTEDYLFYSLKNGSFSLPNITNPFSPTGVGATGADIIWVKPGNVATVVDPGTALGLLPTDDVDALKCIKSLVDLEVEDFWLQDEEGAIIEPGQTITLPVSEWLTLTAGEYKHYQSSVMEGPASIVSQVSWSVSGAVPGELNVQWVDQNGDECTYDGAPVPCETGEPLYGDIDDLHWQIELPYSQSTPVNRDILLHCKPGSEGNIYPLTFVNGEFPLGANDLDPGNNVRRIQDIYVECEEAPLPQNPSFSIERPGPSAQPLGGIDAADIMVYSPYGPIVSCPALGLPVANCHGGDDVDALSIRGDFDQAPPDGLHWLAFSVTEGSVGAAGTAVNREHMCIGSTGAEPEADEFWSKGFGDNRQVFDGNGAPCDGNAGVTMNLKEAWGAPPKNDDLDALDDDAPLTAPPPVYFSLDPTSPSLGAGGSPADIFASFAGGVFWTYAPFAILGLAPTDDIDALCITDGGDESHFDDGDVIYFSLAKGSPSLTAPGHNWSAADILVKPFGAGAPVIYMPAAALGLNPALDDLDALKCYQKPADLLKDGPPANGLPDYWEAQQSCGPLSAGADWDSDLLTDDAEFNIGTDPCVVDTDKDGCADSEEVGAIPSLGGTRNPLFYWDFYDVPYPAIYTVCSSPGVCNPVPTKDRVAGGITTDVQALLKYAGFKNGVHWQYNVDLDANTVMDGVEYDRTNNNPPPWSGPPDGTAGGITTDVTAMLKQAGHKCVAPP
jgi:hypothetical protein